MLILCISILKNDLNCQFRAEAKSTELNSFCYEHDTVVVVKSLQQKMSGIVIYPGVSTYERGKDLKYYNQLTFIF